MWWTNPEPIDGNEELEAKRQLLLETFADALGLSEVEIKPQGRVAWLDRRSTWNELTVGVHEVGCNGHRCWVLAINSRSSRALEGIGAELRPHLQALNPGAALPDSPKLNLTWQRQVFVCETEAEDAACWLASVASTRGTGRSYSPAPFEIHAEGKLDRDPTTFKDVPHWDLDEFADAEEDVRSIGRTLTDYRTRRGKAALWKYDPGDPARPWERDKEKA